MKTFDIENFNKNKTGNEYRFFTNDSTLILQRERQLEYKETIKSNESYFEIINRYYKSGKLKSSVKNFPNRFLAGIMKEYDEQGNLIKETDHDAPFKFGWDDVLALIKKREIDMDAYGFEVNRGSNEKAASWTVTYNKSEKDMLLGIINIDGITGEITREIEIGYPEEE